MTWIASIVNNVIFFVIIIILRRLEYYSTNTLVLLNNTAREEQVFFPWQKDRFFLLKKSFKRNWNYCKKIWFILYPNEGTTEWRQLKPVVKWGRYGLKPPSGF